MNDDRRDRAPMPMPMPLERYQELVQRREAGLTRPDPLQTVPRRNPATSTSPLAAELLAEAATRPLESGELLLVSEEATLLDLERAAEKVPLALAAPGVPDDEPMLAELVEPRLLSPRLWEAFGWQPGLAEHLKRLEAVLRAGVVLPQVMLVGHLETFPERVEHLARLRQLARSCAQAHGGVVLTMALAGPEHLAAAAAGRDDAKGADRADRVAALVREAQPARPEVDLRHALAVARLALEPGQVARPLT